MRGNPFRIGRGLPNHRTPGRGRRVVSTGWNIMRWKNAVAGLALTVAGIVGCKQTCFLTECDYDRYRQIVSEMPRLECDGAASITPATRAMPEPANVDNPDRKLRFL